MYMKKLMLLTLSCAFVALNTACSVDGNIIDETRRSQKQVAAKLTGIVPGAIVQTTAGGYKIEASVGDVYGALKTTNADGYTVYSNVQGNIISQSYIWEMH
jgi:hypothetical protein